MFPVAICTVGCKLNQVESEALADSFRRAGFSIVPWTTKIEGTGIVIVNTCTVTSKADQKTRILIRKALRKNTGSCVIVTGCYAKLDPGEIEALEADIPDGAGRLFVPQGGDEGTGATKSALLDLPGYIVEAARQGNDLPEIMGLWMTRRHQDEICQDIKDPFGFNPEKFTFHSRGYLKIQDGCDNRCTYCRARLARGPSVSLSPDAALAQLRSLEEKGCAEMVIAGMNVAQYRHSGFDLARLLEYLLEGSETIALRMSSLEPEGIDDGLVSVLAHPRIRPHFHLSVQSGSEDVLRKMGRAYGPSAVEEAAEMLRSVKDNPFLACDMIAGFPGETEADFDLTLALCEKIRFAWIHSFPFSPRPGTLAYSLEGQVREWEIRRRADVLTDMAWQGRRAYVETWLGKELCAVVENEQTWERQCWVVSENYLKLIVNCADKAPPPGSSLRCVPVSLCLGANGENPDAVANMVDGCS
ncbi:MAG: tRNA (N(6)-L-threonylcarbamoyladenosine(37)-C(2))-methylthiotransferase MtaB [Treponema sp.]|nr:tRNA (N(6)-L-threonylcarbamoyladenosine(37)-C(2))-methylthiotransferase MtaB [Treponema sp.]